MKNCTVILGCEDGNFTISVRPFDQSGGKGRVRKTFPASKPGLVKDYLQTIYDKYQDVIFMCSSSVEFPEEYNVTKKQIKKLWETLGVKS